MELTWVCNLLSVGNKINIVHSGYIDLYLYLNTLHVFQFPVNYKP